MKSCTYSAWTWRKIQNTHHLPWLLETQKLTTFVRFNTMNLSHIKFPILCSTCGILAADRVVGALELLAGSAKVLPRLCKLFMRVELISNELFCVCWYFMLLRNIASKHFFCKNVSYTVIMCFCIFKSFQFYYFPFKQFHSLAM